jgi:hypothetical protein
VNSQPGRHRPHHRDPARLALDPALGEWWRRLDQASRLLGTSGSDRADAVDCLLNLGQKFIPCRRRGTHRSLHDCNLCAGDYLRGDAGLDELLVAPPDRLRPDGWGRV